MDEENSNKISSILVKNNKKKKAKITFKIFDFIKNNNHTILKIKLKNNLICRIKIVKTESLDGVKFDIVDDDVKEIKYIYDKIFYQGYGIGGNLFLANFISQWEIPVIDLIIRAFLFKNLDELQAIIEKFNVKLSKDAEWFIRNEEL